LQERKPLIRRFLEQNVNSTMTPGKKDTITRGGVKKQKRFLNTTLKNLYNKFLEENPNDFISYCSFCRYRPFWIVEMKISDRDTCLCKLHENVKFMINKLHELNILQSKDLDKICELVTCDQRRKSCMTRSCNRCKNSKFQVNDFENYGMQVEFYSWNTATEIYETDGKNVRTQKVVKEPNQTTVEHLLNDAQDLVKTKFCNHVFNIRHQFCSLKSLCDNLQTNEILRHVDFSENYACKLSDEIQRLHFGGSRHQVSLHTSVLYSSTDTQSFCTISECLQHGPAAIWTHLHPIFTFIKENNSIDTFHIVSDGPTSQYRSKTNFYLFHKFIHEKYAFKLSTWNFTEAGHGKSAANGIGGVVKRTADRLVSQGNDITTAKDFFNYLSECNIDVNLYLVSQSDVEIISSSVRTCLPGVKNTMKLHQVISIQGENRIHIRKR
jgi:hypothetical protein